MKLYKAFRADGRTLHGRDPWPQPTDSGPGEWMPAVEGPLEPCRNGYHLMREQDLPYWPGWSLYEAEAEGEVVEAGDKVVARRARLVRRLAWDARKLSIWLADCAEHVLPIFEEHSPQDSRPRECIRILREYIAGRASADELRAAAYAAASAADAAADAAAYAADAAAYAARAAAAPAATPATPADAYVAAAKAAYAARDAAADACAERERKWQAARMLELLAETEAETKEGRP